GVASGAAATRAAKEATTTIPIVAVAVQDPVALGSVQSLGRPGGNITGPTLTGGLAIVGKQLELLKETVPGVSRVAVLWNPTNPMLLQQLRDTEIAARSLNVQLRPVEGRSPDEFDRAFSRITREARGSASRQRGPDVRRPGNAVGKSCGKEPPASDVRAEAECGDGRPHGLWGERA